MDAGFATTVVGCDDRQAVISVAKRGESSVNGDIWGQYSAVDIVDDSSGMTAWFAGSEIK